MHTRLPQIAILAAMLTVLSTLPTWGQDGGVSVRRESKLARLVPAAEVEQAAAQQYEKLKQDAANNGSLAPPNDPQLQRVRAVAQRIMPFAAKWNSHASGWKWEVNLLRSNQINAFCMPGGKIAFYSGLINSLKLTDDEIAIVMGHEMTHALREHSRAHCGADCHQHRRQPVVAGLRIGQHRQCGSERLDQPARSALLAR